jgi:hypothetical protein
LCMNTQRKVTGHGDQPKRRNRDTQPNARRPSWVRTDNHDVIAPIKSIEWENKLHVEFTRMADNSFRSVHCCRATRQARSTRKLEAIGSAVVPCSSEFVSAVPAGVLELRSESIARSQGMLAHSARQTRKCLFAETRAYHHELSVSSAIQKLRARQPSGSQSPDFPLSSRKPRRLQSLEEKIQGPNRLADHVPRPTVAGRCSTRWRAVFRLTNQSSFCAGRKLFL